MSNKILSKFNYETMILTYSCLKHIDIRNCNLLNFYLFSILKTLKITLRKINTNYL